MKWVFDMSQLIDKTAVVIGAASAGNMAQVIARRFASEGANVVVSGRNEDELKAFSDQIGGSYILCDITCLLYTSPSPRDLSTSRMPSSA